jgi:hypothetical protein
LTFTSSSASNARSGGATEEERGASSSGKKAYGTGFRIRKQTAIVSRWLHVYLSMVSFAIVLFFGATGLTLNHPDWLASHAQTTRYQGTVPAGLLHEGGGKQPDKLGIVELLRREHKITGAVTDFRVDETQLSVSFQGPGYTADGFIDPTTGAYDLTETRSGFLAVINDLHRGRNTGKVWSAVVDASAILLCLVSLTGLVMIWFILHRRTAGLVLAGIGAVLCYGLYRLFVP